MPPKPDARSIVLSRRAKFVAAALAATGIAIVHERTSHAVDAGADAGASRPQPTAPARDAGPRAPLTKAEKAEREALLARANEAMTEGDLATALAASRRAHTMEPSAELRKRVVVMLIQLVEGFEKEGRLTQALEALEYETSEGALVGDVDPKIQTRLETLRTRVPTITVDGAPKGSRMRVDGFPRPLDGKPLRLDPGEHRITVTADGGTVEEKVLVKEGENTVVRIQPAGAVPVEPPRPCLTDVPPDDRDRDRPRPASCSCDIPGLGR